MEHTNLNNDNFLKHLKTELDAFNRPAPSEIWDGIEHVLDYDSIDNQLKSSLENLNKKAPAFIWSNIETNINNNEPGKEHSADMILDSKLREAVGTKLSAPETIWYGIEQQLNIDAVWDNMQPKLNKLKKAYLRRQFLKMLSAAALLLLFFRTCSFDDINIQPNGVSDVKMIENIQIADPLADNKLSSNSISDNSEILNVIENSDVLTEKKERKTEKKDEILQDNHEYLAEPNETKQIKDVIKLNPTLAYSTKTEKELTDFNKNNLLSVAELTVKKAEQLAVEKIVFPEIDINATNLKSQKTVKHKYDIGAIATVNRAILINDQNTKNLSTAIRDKVEILPSLSYSYALQMGFHFNEKHSLMAEFWYNSKIRQEYSYRIHGKQTKQVVDLNYVKINVLYRPVLFAYGFENRNKITSAFGLYLSNLKHISYNTDNSFTIDMPAANEWDTGLSLSIGQEHAIGKSIIIDYGLRNEIGFSSVFKTTRYIPSKTSHLGLGAYLAMRYRF